MGWHKEWQSIQESITEFTTICNEHVIALSVNQSDSYGTVKNVILPMLIDLTNRISTLGDRYNAQLSSEALELLRNFTEDTLPFKTGFESASASVKSATTVTHFSSLIRRFKSDFNYYTSDLDGVVLRQTARGFSHLQRSIVADQSIREKWICAFNKNEEACEKLGSVHLLQHGIWSFKINSIGEHTDLVLGEPLSDSGLTETYLSSDGLVLTEWKVASEGNSASKFSEALNQAKLYAQGSLASIELKKYRYLVVVSEKQIQTPDDLEQDGVVYKHVNIAVDPISPSLAARKNKSKG